MFGQQHTIPMTADGEDHSSGGLLFPCTQPTTSQTRGSGGFLLRLSQRTSSLKPVAASGSDEDIRPWGSCADLKPLSVISEESVCTWGSRTELVEAPSLPRSPSLPSLSRAGHLKTPRHDFTNSRLAGLGLAHELHTPNHTLNSSQRAPLQPITPQQHTLTTFVKPKNSVVLEKENSQQSKDIFHDKVAVTPAWKQQLLREMMQSSPQPLKIPSPETQPFRRNLFHPSPAPQQTHAKQGIQLQLEPTQYEPNSQEVPQNPIQDYRPMQDSVPFSSRPQQPVNQHVTPLPPRIQEQKFATPLPMKKLEQITPRQHQAFENQATPQMSQRQLESCFKPPARPVSEQEHKIKTPAVKVEPQEVIVVNRVAYSVDQRIGRGGSSEVFQVTRQGDGAVLAIKCVDLRAVDDAIRAGYLNEITLLERMHASPRVVQLIDYELCEDRQVLFVVMEKGARDLASFLKERSRRRDLRIGTVEAFWRDMVEAVAEIHDEGIIHSDLKPANFLLVGEVGFHQLKLIDFGIASSLQSDMTSVVRDTPAGTLNYMSPEAVRGMQGQHCPVKINRKSDIWSLGCILYNLLYGRTPFQHVTHAALKAEAICNPRHAIEFPTHSPSLPGDGEIPSALLHTVRQCLAREPATRPSARELLTIKYCGCDDFDLGPLVQGMAGLLRGHPLGMQFVSQLAAAMQEGERKTS